MKSKQHIFTGTETAMAYAISAERLCENNTNFLKANPTCVPIFVSLLYQSLEISIKQAGIDSGLFTLQEVLHRQYRSGHGIEEIAALAVEKLGGNNFEPVIMAMTFKNQKNNSAEIINQMICGKKLKRTRECYASRCLGYAQVSEGDFAIIKPVKQWVDAVKETALNLPSAINVITQWKNTAKKSEHFLIWLNK